MKEKKKKKSKKRQESKHVDDSESSEDEAPTKEISFHECLVRSRNADKNFVAVKEFATTPVRSSLSTLELKSQERRFLFFSLDAFPLSLSLPHTHTHTHVRIASLDSIHPLTPPTTTHTHTHRYDPRWETLCVTSIVLKRAVQHYTRSCLKEARSISLRVILYKSSLLSHPSHSNSHELSYTQVNAAKTRQHQTTSFRCTTVISPRNLLGLWGNYEVTHVETNLPYTTRGTVQRKCVSFRLLRQKNIFARSWVL